MEPQILPKTQFFPIFSCTNFEVAFSKVKNVKINVSSRRYAHFQGSKGAPKHTQNHQKNSKISEKNYTKNLVVFLHRHFIDFSSILGSNIGPKLETTLVRTTLGTIFFLSYFSLRWLGAFGRQNGPQNQSKIEKNLHFQSQNAGKSDCFFRDRFWSNACRA